MSAANPQQDRWADDNQRYLTAALDRVRARITAHAERGNDSEVTSPVTEDTSKEQEIAEDMQCEPALQTVARVFRLSSFELDVLLLCAGVEFESALAPLCAAAQGHPQRDYPTFSLALAAFPTAHWSALSPSSPLRYWKLVHVEPGNHSTSSRLKIDERILHFLAGVDHLDPRLGEVLQAVPLARELVPSHQRIAEEVGRALAYRDPNQPMPVIQLCGNDIDGKRSIAALASASLGAAVYRMPIAAMPNQLKERETLRHLWRRDSVLSHWVLMLDADSADRGDRWQESTIARFVEDADQPILLSSRERLGPWQRPTLTMDVSKPSITEQRQLWKESLGDLAQQCEGELDQVVHQFHLSAPQISAVGRSTKSEVSAAKLQKPATLPNLGNVLWRGCRSQARPQLDELAQRIESAAGWDQLILPNGQKERLQEICGQVRHRAQVHQRWGWESQGKRGLGLSVLFAGPSGTGKTMAAEVLAGELALDLYRIDLSAVVSKYIGETEKNLRQVFDAAEIGGVILLFDEADALFGKRSEVKDSHDRHANIEVSYLLQRIESYRGLAILTTNLKDSLDQAFLRRLRFTVNFPFPDVQQRVEIWKTIFPESTPTQDLDAHKLARLNLAGGNIRNIAVAAAFSAAAAGTAVSMGHIAQASRREYEKLDRPLTTAEVRDW